MQFYVKDIMSTDILTINSTDSIKDLITLFTDNDITGVPVLNRSGFVVGVVSNSDVIKNESSHSYYNDPFMRNFHENIYEDSTFFEQTVSLIMSEDLYTIEPGDTIAKMAKIMYEKKIHRLLVIEYDKLIGIVTTFDLLKLLATNDEQLIL